jgi:hypothetical protein
VAAKEEEIDAGLFEFEAMLVELVRQDFGMGTRIEQGGKGSCGSFEILVGTEKGAKGIDDGMGRRRGIEGLTDFIFGAVKQGSRGEGASESGGVARGVGANGCGRAESGTDGIAKHAENGGNLAVKSIEDFGLGAAGAGCQFGQGDGESASFEVRRGREITGDGEGRFVQSWTGSRWPDSRKRTPVPEARRQRASESRGERDET